MGGNAQVKQKSNGGGTAFPSQKDSSKNRPKSRKGSGLAAAARKFDTLTKMPMVYEPFMSSAFFFDSALRVPPSLTPLRYALEIIMAAELICRRQ